MPASASAWSTASTSINPTFEQRKQSKLDLIVAGSKDGLVMVEAGAKEVSEDQVVQALDAAHAAIKQIVASIDDLAKEAGKKKLTVAKKEIAADFFKEIEAKVLGPLTDAMRIRGKLENYETVDLTLKDPIAALPESEAEKKADAKAIFKELKEKVLRDEVLSTTSGSTAASSTKSARSGSRPACSRAPTGPPCSRAAKRRRSSPARSARPTMRRKSRASRARRGRASCSTTTSRPSRSAKWAA